MLQCSENIQIVIPLEGVLMVLMSIMISKHLQSGLEFPKLWRKIPTFVLVDFHVPPLQKRKKVSLCCTFYYMQFNRKVRESVWPKTCKHTFWRELWNTWPFIMKRNLYIYVYSYTLDSKMRALEINRHMRSSTFETKLLDSRNSHVCHSTLIYGSTQINLMYSNVDLFMYLIKGIRFSTWKDRCLNWSLQIILLKQSTIRVKWHWNPINCSL